MIESKAEWRTALLLLPLVALLAVHPLIAHGCSCGHDFDFHLLSWMEAATQFAHGNLHPQWAFTPAFNAGEPRFVFYPPFSWTVGAVLGMILPWGAVPVVYTWLCLTAAALTCFLFLGDFVPQNASLVVAALYAVNPYMLFTAFERTAYAELLAAAWLPLLLREALRERVSITRLALPLALLWLTNAPAAVIGCYGLVLLAVVRLLFTLRAPGHETGQLAFRLLAGTALGLGLASFYILPAAYERSFVQIRMAMVEGMRIGDNFLFHHTADADHDRVLLTASLIAVGLLAAACLAAVFAVRQERRGTPRYLLPANITLIVVIAFLLTPVSALIWRYTPDLPFLQFPWRLLALLTPVLSLLLAFALARIRLTTGQTTATVLLLPLLLIVPSYRVFRQPCDPGDTVAARLALFHSNAGTDPTDEYTPITADNDALHRANPPYWLAVQAGAAPPAGATPGPLHGPFDLASARPQVLILNLRDYPSWRIRLYHQPVTTRLQRDDGLIAIPVPAGALHVEMHYQRGMDQIAGDAISLASCIVLLLTLRRRPAPR